MARNAQGQFTVMQDIYTRDIEQTIRYGIFTILLLKPFIADRSRRAIFVQKRDNWEIDVNVWKRCSLSVAIHRIDTDDTEHWLAQDIYNANPSWWAS